MTKEGEDNKSKLKAAIERARSGNTTALLQCDVTADDLIAMKAALNEYFTGRAEKQNLKTK
jgi:hypothetical protein